MKRFRYADRIRIATPSIGIAALHNERGTVRTVVGPDAAVCRMDKPVPAHLRMNARDPHLIIVYTDECCPTGRQCPDGAARLRGEGSGREEAA